MSAIPDDGTDSTLRADLPDGPSTPKCTDGPSPEHKDTVSRIGPLKLRARTDDLPQKWWVASTAIPLIAATIGPLCNVLSIAALVSPWRVTLANNGQLPEGTDDSGVGIADPRWEIICNAVSLACGFTGNFFLLLNFTGRVRYIVALPLSIVFWILSCFLLLSIISAMHVHVPPRGPGQIYSQGFWHAVLAAVLYLIGAIILVVNLTGYLLGHFPQNFVLNSNERTLILQTMGFFFWLAGGAGIFCAIEGFTFANALYYADVSVLTIGFGDFYPSSDAGRGFLFVFELLGIVQLGLVIGSVSHFVASISADKIVRAHQAHARAATVSRAVASEQELRERLGLPPLRGQQLVAATGGREGDGSAMQRAPSLSRYGRLEIVGRTVTFHEAQLDLGAGGRGAGWIWTHPKMGGQADSLDAKVRQGGSKNERRHQKRQKLLLLHEERDRFEAMREIQDGTRRFKQYSAMLLSLLAFVLLWFLGALVFFSTERRILGLSYFQSLYFCFVSLFTIGYGDFAPKSNIGKPFFVVWSIFAVPTMTVWSREMSATVIAAVNNWTTTIADLTILPKEDIFKITMDDNPGRRQWATGLVQRKAGATRVTEGFPIQNADIVLPHVGKAGNGNDRIEDEEDTALDAKPEGQGRAIARRTVNRGKEDTDHDLASQLAQTIKSVAHDLGASPSKRYSFEQWVRFTKLIRFSCWGREQDLETNEEKTAGQHGVIDWDWLGENSPMLADTEAQWLLDRLCESLHRYMRRQATLISRWHEESPGKSNAGIDKGAS